jgi:hypothetical protein
MFNYFALLAQSGRLTNPVATNLAPTSVANGATLFNSIIQNTVTLLFITGVLIFMLFFFIGAFKWMLSSGDKGGLQNAREAVLHAVIGLFIMFALYAVLKLVEIFLGVCLINLGVPGLNDTATSRARCGYGSTTDTTRDQYYLNVTPTPKSGGGSGGSNVQ